MGQSQMTEGRDIGILSEYLSSVIRPLPPD
jgi:hypothetical protein